MDLVAYEIQAFLHHLTAPVSEDSEVALSVFLACGVLVYKILSRPKRALH